MIDTVDEIAVKVRQYLGVTALTSVITGVATGLWAVTVELELALVWAILNFLLNFIPVIGNIIGIHDEDGNKAQVHENGVAVGQKCSAFRKSLRFAASCREIPPTLYAVIQFQSLPMTLVVFFGFAILQIGISNFIYPALQGHQLSLSPVAIVAALAFWSWVWGIAGALLAVPLTAALVIICEHFRSTTWVARLLSTPKSE